MDSAAAAAEEIKPYVDGKAVSFTKTASGTGAGNFANSSLNFMSRAASSLFGAGSLDEVAIYNRALDAATIAAHYAGNPLAPTASFDSLAQPRRSRRNRQLQRLLLELAERRDRQIRVGPRRQRQL